MDFQNFLSTIVQEDTIAMSAYEFIKKRSEAASTLLSDLQEACSSSDLIITTISSPILIQIEGADVSVNPQDILNAIHAGEDSVAALTAQGSATVAGIDTIIDQITDSVSISYSVAESFWVLAQGHLQTAADKMGAFYDRLMMKFASIPDVAASYGYAILGVLEDNNSSVIEKTKTIMSFIGFGDTPPSPALPLPTNDLSDITGANVYTAFSADVTEAANNAFDVAKNVFNKIGQGIKKVVGAVAEPVVTKVKQTFGAILTTNDAWLVSDADAKFRGFTDMGSVTKYEATGSQGSLQAKLSTTEYLVFDLGLCRCYCWLDPSEEYYYIKTYTRPLPYNAFTYGTSVSLSNGNPHASINDLIIAIMSDGSVAMPTTDEIYAVLAEVLSVQWEAPGSYEYDEFDTWNPDSHMWVSIKHSQMAAALVLLCIANEESGVPLNFDNLKQSIEVLFGDPEAFVNSNQPANASNLDIAKALTGCYSTGVTPGSVHYRALVEWDMRMFITQALGNVMNNTDYYFSYYHSNSVPSGMYSVYRDSQLSSVISTLVITVAAVVTSIVILKTLGKAKRSLFSTRAKIASLEREAFANPGSIDQTKLNTAYKLNKRANLLQRITTGFAGSSKAAFGIANSSNGFMQTSGQFNLNNMDSSIKDKIGANETAIKNSITDSNSAIEGAISDARDGIHSDVDLVGQLCLSIQRDIK